MISTEQETRASGGASWWQYCVVHRRAVVQDRGFQAIRSNVLCSQLKNRIPCRDYNTAVLKWTQLSHVFSCIWWTEAGASYHNALPESVKWCHFNSLWSMGQKLWGPEAALDVVQLSSLQVLYPTAEQQMDGGCQYPLYCLGACELELWLSEMWFLFGRFK